MDTFRVPLRPVARPIPATAAASRARSARRRPRTAGPGLGTICERRQRRPHRVPPQSSVADGRLQASSTPRGRRSCAELRTAYGLPRGQSRPGGRGGKHSDMPESSGAVAGSYYASDGHGVPSGIPRARQDSTRCSPRWGAARSMKRPHGSFPGRDSRQVAATTATSTEVPAAVLVRARRGDE